MSRSGAGVYSKPSGTTAVSGAVISSTTFNTLIDDLVDDANTARPIVAGGTGAASASAARTALGVQALDATLTAFAALLTGAGKVPYATGADTASEADSTSYGRSLWNVADEAALKTLINAEAGVDFQAYDADTSKTDVAATWSAAQRIPPAISSETSGTLTSANSANAIVVCTSGVTLTPSNFAAGTIILLLAGASSRTLTRGGGAMNVNGTDSGTATLAANSIGVAVVRTTSIIDLGGAVT